jgi:uncharacterized protein YlzI (FlbEa/FlbD family)
MKYIAIADELLINPEFIISIEKRKTGKVVITTSDGKQHIIEKDFKTLIPNLIKAGVDSPEQFWVG